LQNTASGNDVNIAAAINFSGLGPHDYTIILFVKMGSLSTTRLTRTTCAV
jgi:hypothetical protein